jgi:Polysaccharide biosynthesis enzyme WcbI
MDRAVVVGNCQAKALELMLATNDAFAARFELVSFPAVHEIPDAMVPELHAAVAGAALVLTQRVDEGYRDGIGLGTETIARFADGATVVRWPSVYWAGYVPDLFYLRDAAGAPVIDGPFDYHDRTILDAYTRGTSVAGALALLADPARTSDALEQAERAIAELEVRGRDCDVDVAPYIAERFRDELLFFTMNHPANVLLAHMADQVLALLGLPGPANPVRLGPDDLLGSTFYPLHANHVRALGLRFGATAGAGCVPFRIRGCLREAPDAIGDFFAYYDAHPELVELNCVQAA